MLPPDYMYNYNGKQYVAMDNLSAMSPSFCYLFNTPDELAGICEKLTVLRNKEHYDDRKPWKTVKFASIGMSLIDNFNTSSPEKIQNVLDEHLSRTGHEHPFPELLKPLPYKGAVIVIIETELGRGFDVDTEFKCHPRGEIDEWCTDLYLWPFVALNAVGGGNCCIPFNLEHIKYHTSDKKGWVYGVGGRLVEYQYHAGDWELALEPLDLQHGDK